MIIHGKAVRAGASYDNRFTSVITIEPRKIVQSRDYMDTLAAMTALNGLDRRRTPWLLTELWSRIGGIKKRRT